MWACNVPAISVFQLCVLSGIGTMSRIFWLGFSAQEIASAIDTAEIPSEDRFSVASDVSYMGKVLANVYNKAK